MRALEDASFSALSGEVHGLVGENGAGKSTLIKIISGLVRPDQGSFHMSGQPVHFRLPIDSQRAGIQTVFQELTLIPDLSVADNILRIRDTPSNLGRMANKRANEEADSVLKSLGIAQIDPRLLIRDISLPERQIVEICKSLHARPKILIFDEATSALLGPNVDWLYGLVDRLRQQNVCIIFTSHRWDEVKRFTDRITIMRNGRTIETRAAAETTEVEATRLMAGREINLIYPQLPPPNTTRVRLGVRSVTAEGLSDISFDLHPGEIFGIGGLQGQGQRELFQALFGMRDFTGTLSVDGKNIKIRSPRDSIDAGIGFIPEDRKTEGLLLTLNVRENTSLTILRTLTRLGIVRKREEAKRVSRMVDALSIKTADLNQPIRELSGGNQQKVVLAKWLLTEVPILLFYDVTRGVDVGTKHEIYGLMADLAAHGSSILFYSTETAELVKMSHRVGILYDGSLIEVISGPDLTQERIVGAAIGSTTVGGNT
ncbi:MAG: sugar ABC transporter ATP-binding protein [Bacilli bacterium]